MMINENIYRNKFPEPHEQSHSADEAENMSCLDWIFSASIEKRISMILVFDFPLPEEPAD